MMDTYTGADVPYVTMLGINKSARAARGFLAVGAKGGSTWAATEIITAANIGSQSVNYAASAGNAATATTATNLSGGTVSATTGSFSGAFGCNGISAQTSYSVNSACSDLATAIALINQLRAALIANGICV